MDKEYRKALSEVACIIEQSDGNYRSKIPESFLQFVLSNADPDYHPQFDIETPLKDLPLRKETKGVLSLIYRSYICTPEERIEFDRILQENEIKRKQELYDQLLQEEEKKKQNSGT
ncbi:MAG: hypothetical protein K6G90_06555 [Clostridia bacterium]|nr:hypothetical protein [Clostridia bacterium]